LAPRIILRLADEELSKDQTHRLLLNKLEAFREALCEKEADIFDQRLPALIPGFDDLSRDVLSS
jgi:hypothetical protein